MADLAGVPGRLLAVTTASQEHPSWPLAVIFVGYPVWWLLGLVEPAILVACVLMAYSLWGRFRSSVPPYVGWWLLFVVWSLAGVVVLQLIVPGAVPDPNPNRILLWALRTLGYLEATVVLMFAVDLARRRGPLRVSRTLAPMFVTVVVGGLAGYLAPTLGLRSALEVGLGSLLPDNDFVATLVHPLLAERHVYLGVVTYRPSAPFPYTNEWGLTYACLLPFFVHAWCGRDAGWRRIAAAIVLAASIVPVVYSSNRALWGELLLSAALYGVLSGRLRSPRAVAAASAVVLVVVVAAALSPLGSSVVSRLQNPTSNAGRISLSVNSVVGMARSSPVVGAGTTRPPEGARFSIAGGNTATCPFCLQPSFGTQGALWAVLFTTGFVGAVAFFGFFARTLWLRRRRREPADIAAILGLSAFLATAPFYDISSPTLFAAMSAIGMLAGRRPTGQLPRPPVPRLWLAAALTILGLIGGLAGFAMRGPVFTATAAVYLPVSDGIGPAVMQSMDTEARFVQSRTVRSVVAASSSRGDAVTGEVAAEPNTRLLLVRYTADSRRVADSAAEAASGTLLKMREDRLRAARRGARLQLALQNATLKAQLQTLRESMSALQTNDGVLSSVDVSERAVIAQISTTQQKILALQGRPDAGSVRSLQVEQRPDEQAMFAVSGLMLGLLAAVLFARAVDRRGPALRRRRRFVSGALVPLLPGPVLGWDPTDDLAAFARRFSTRRTTFLSADPDEDLTRQVSTRLEQVATTTDRRGARHDLAATVALVVSDRTTWRVLRKQVTHLRHDGWDIVGFVLVRQPPAGPAPQAPEEER